MALINLFFANHMNSLSYKLILLHFSGDLDVLEGLVTKGPPWIQEEGTKWANPSRPCIIPDAEECGKLGRPVIC